MTEATTLLNAVAAALLALGLLHRPAVAARLGRSGLMLLLVGTQVPLLGLTAALAASPDRIALLTRLPAFQAPYPLLLWMGGIGLVSGFVLPWRRVGRALLLVGAGLALNLALAFLTPAGVSLLPFAAGHASWPVLWEGHPLLIAGLILLLAALEALPRMRAPLVTALGLWTALYLAAGAGQHELILKRTALVADTTGVADVVPANPWLTRWLVVAVEGDRYRLWQASLWEDGLGEAKEVPRWNDGPRLLRALQDPVVYAFYYGAFRHPVVRLDGTDSQITLTMQELAYQDRSPTGRTFYGEIGLDDSLRFYQLERFH